MDNDGDEKMNEHVFDGCRIEIDEVEWKNIGSLWRRNFILIGLLMVDGMYVPCAQRYRK